MVSRPLVSILMPCYNAANVLEQTLSSALEQSWPNLEIVIVDDGSNDHSLTIARRFQSDRVRVIAQPNAGAAAARNRAWRESRGTFLQYLDADDLLSPRKIELQVELLERGAPDRVASCAWGRFIEQPQDAKFIDHAVYRDFAPLEFLTLAGRTGAMMHPAAWLVPRTIAQRAGPWQENRSPCDDGEYFCRVLLASSGITYCDDPGARTFYRSAQARSLSRQRGSRARRDHFESFDSITRRLLAAEDSARTRTACAGYWRQYVHTYYPSPPDLIQEAERRIVSLGEKIGRPAMGPKTAALAAMIGWRNVWRLRDRLLR